MISRFPGLVSSAPARAGVSDSSWRRRRRAHPADGYCSEGGAEGGGESGSFAPARRFQAAAANPAARADADESGPRGVDREGPEPEGTVPEGAETEGVEPEHADPEAAAPARDKYEAFRSPAYHAPRT